MVAGKTAGHEPQGSFYTPAVSAAAEVHCHPHPARRSSLQATERECNWSSATPAAVQSGPITPGGRGWVFRRPGASANSFRRGHSASAGRVVVRWLDLEREWLCWGHFEARSQPRDGLDRSTQNRGPA